ncbi:MAG: hypothetical protein WBF59_16235 [Bradyrhizobium sp.]
MSCHGPLASMEARAFGGAMVSVVIPGRLAEANPESIMRPECWEEWIPDSRYTASGMTEEGIAPKIEFPKRNQR